MTKKAVYGNSSRPVCYFTTSWRGGDGWYSHSLAEAIAEAGQPLVFIASRLIPSERDARHHLIRRRLVPSNSATPAGLISKLVRNGIRVLRFMYELIRARMTSRTYLVTFPHWIIFTYISFIVIRALGGRIVYIVHDPLPHAWSFPTPLRTIERWLLRQTYVLSNRLVTLTHAGKATLVSEFDTEPAKIRVIPHGAFPIAGAKPPTATRHLLLFGMLRRNKNILQTVEAFRSVLGEFPDLELTIAGAPHRDDLAYWAVCEQAIASSPPGIHVEAGFVSEARVSELFEMCDGVLLPYEDFNSQSGVAVLAAFAKRPVLTTGVGGIRELIDLGLVSFPIACPVTVEAISDSIRMFCQQKPGDLASEIESGYSRIADALSWPGVGRSFAELLSETDGPEGRCPPN